MDRYTQNFFFPIIAQLPRKGKRFVECSENYENAGKFCAFFMPQR